MKILLLAIRPLMRFRTYTLINVLGLALSLACVIIISRYVYSELRTDHFYPDLERLYTTTEETDRGSGDISFSAVMNPNNEKSFSSILEHPAVECTTLLRLDNEVSCWYKEKEYSCQTLIADSNCFKIVQFPLLTGTNTLSKPDEAVITQSYAQKLFGNKNALGKQVQLSIGETVTIAGIVGEPTTASSLHFDLVISDRLSRHWNRKGIHLVRLYPKTDYKQVNNQYNKFMRMDLWKYSIRHQLYPLSEVYFNKNIYKISFRSGNFTYIWILSLVAAMILLVGVFNFVNIYSVVILRRGREFGMKKVFGAGTKMIFGQLFLENVLMAGIALFISWVLVEISDPIVRNQLEITPVANKLFDIILSVSILFILPFLTSLIPFIRYNYSTPITSLRSINRDGNSVVSRKIFLTTQYIITFVLTICSLFFIKQLRFMLNTDPGIRTKDVIQAQFVRDNRIYSFPTREAAEKEREKTNKIVEALKQKLNASPLIEHWTYGDSPVGKGMNDFQFKRLGGEYKDFSVIYVSPEWMKLFDIKLTEGELSEETPSMDYTLYISESGKELLDITDINTTEIQPERRLWYNLDGDMDANPPYRILGTFNDFNLCHQKLQNNPIIIHPSSSWYEEPLIASIAPGRRQEAIQFLKELHDELIGGNFEYTFIEDQYKALYRNDVQITLVYSIFALIAILISSLGLFSLSLFDVQQRYREIAIRKVNGATTIVVMRMLLQKYYMLLGIAFLIAAPISWLAINRYLEDFAHKAPVSWWIFAVALLITAGISLATLIWQIRKAAETDPAKAMKAE